MVNIEMVMRGQNLGLRHEIFSGLYPNPPLSFSAASRHDAIPAVGHMFADTDV